MDSYHKPHRHFNILKLHAMTYYINWIRYMGTLNNVNTAVIETFHKTVKESYYHTNKVDYIKQICFWDN